VEIFSPLSRMYVKSIYQEKGRGYAQRKQNEIELPAIVVADAWFKNELVETMLIHVGPGFSGNK
jgi:hypothetical protein